MIGEVINFVRHPGEYVHSAHLVMAAIDRSVKMDEEILRYDPGVSRTAPPNQEFRQGILSMMKHPDMRYVPRRFVKALDFFYTQKTVEPFTPYRP